MSTMETAVKKPVVKSVVKKKGERELWGPYAKYKLPKITAETKFVFPEDAEKIISIESGLFMRNRTERPHATLKYVRDMKSGDFRINGEPICVSNKGRYLNGFHRLKAIVKADIPVPMLFIYGVEDKPEIIDTIDTGTPRNLKDILNLRGYPATHRHTTCLKSMFFGNRGGGVNGGWGSAGYKFNNTAWVGIYELHEDAINFAVNCLNKRGAVSNKKTLAAIARAYYHFSEDDLIHFCDVLKTGEVSSKRDLVPAKLKNELEIRALSKKGEASTHNAYKIIITRLWEYKCSLTNKFFDEVKIGEMLFSDEQIFTLPHEDVRG